MGKSVQNIVMIMIAAAIVISVMIITSCTSPPPGDIEEDGDVYCPEDPFSAQCGPSTFEIEEDCSCGEEALSVGTRCLANDNDLEVYGRDPNFGNRLCGNLQLQGRMPDKCCSQHGTLERYRREVFIDCLPGNIPPISRDAPQCWVQMASPRCTPFWRTDSTNECSVSEYYGICFTECRARGDICAVGKNQCCKAGCRGGGIPDPSQQINLTCIPDYPGGDVGSPGTCQTGCPDGQVQCGDECYTPSEEQACCVKSDGTYSEVYYTHARYQDSNGEWHTGTNPMLCCPVSGRAYDPFETCCNCPRSDYCYYDAFGQWKTCHTTASTTTTTRSTTTTLGPTTTTIPCSECQASNIYRCCVIDHCENRCKPKTGYEREPYITEICQEDAGNNCAMASCMSNTGCSN